MNIHRTGEREAVSAWESLEFGPCSSIVRVPQGALNDVFFVNHDFVMRVNSHETDAPRYRREKIACELLSTGPVPVPEILCVDESKERLPLDFMIMRRLGGRQLAEEWLSVGERVRETLARRAGHLLGLIHQYTFERFGNLENLPEGEQQWKDHVERMLEHHLKESSDLGLFGKEVGAKLEQVVADRETLLSSVKTPSFVHGDYHYENVLSEKGTITGVLDFEHAHAGDPELDFRNVPNRDRECPGAEPLLREGYNEVRTFSPEFQEKLDLYRLLYLLELCVASYKFWPDERFPRIKEDFLTLLRQVP